MKDKLSLSTATLWILLSVVLISGTAFMAWLYYIHVLNHRLHQKQYNIHEIIQKNSQAESLSTNFLAELLNLSADQPTSIYAFSKDLAEKRLLQFPLIRTAVIKKIRPNIIYIDYSLTAPVAYLGGVTNTAIDKYGVMIPMHPFFTPKVMPTFFLSLPAVVDWGVSLQANDEFAAALSLLNLLSKVLPPNYLVQEIDTHNMYSKKLGQQEIVVVLIKTELDQSKKVYVRLNSANFLDNIKQLLAVERAANIDADHIVDLRISGRAFVKTAVTRLL